MTVGDISVVTILATDVYISLFPPHIRKFTYTKQHQNANNTDSSTTVNVKERRNVRVK